MIVCVLLPRFTLIAAGGRRRDLLGRPVALAPEPGREQRVGEVSAAAEAFGVAPGMRLGEALARCPELLLVAPDPDLVHSLWEELVRRLEATGAAVESERPGTAFFETGGLHRIYGGLDGVLKSLLRASAQQGDRGTASAQQGGRGTASVLRGGFRIGVAPTRFAAHAAALAARPRRPVVVRDGRRFLAPLPVALLGLRPQTAGLTATLERLGIRTLGELAALPRPAVADRFGPAGLAALDLARGEDSPLRPRRVEAPMVERLRLPEAASGQQLERALELLIARLLARSDRRDRTIRALAASARLAGGGSWRTSVTLRQAGADPERLMLALAPRLAALPAPAAELAIEVRAFGPRAHDQVELTMPASRKRLVGQSRDRLLLEAIRQARQAAGDRAALRILQVNPDSRLPERRTMLAPYE